MIEIMHSLRTVWKQFDILFFAYFFLQTYTLSVVLNLQTDILFTFLEFIQL